VSRRFVQPRALAVSPDARGRPAWVRWRGRRERVSICNTWRVEGAWWQSRNGGAGRTYYTLLTASRVALVVFHDEADGRWFLEQILD
jgi:hypothetical protein